MAHDDPFAGQTIDADWAYYLDTAGTYTPTITATTPPNLGADGIAAGMWQRNGHWVSGTARFLFSGAGLSAGSGVFEIDLPFDADVSIMNADTVSGSGAILGGGFVRDDDTTGNSEIVQVQLRSASLVRLKRSGGVTSVANAVPFTWAEGDRISFNFAYLADPADLPS